MEQPPATGRAPPPAAAIPLHHRSSLPLARLQLDHGLIQEIPENYATALLEYIAHLS